MEDDIEYCEYCGEEIDNCICYEDDWDDEDFDEEDDVWP